MIDNRASRRLAKVGRGAKNEIGRPSLLREYLSRRVARRRRSVHGVTSGHTVWQPFRSADTSCAFLGSATPAAAPIRRFCPPPYTYLYICIARPAPLALPIDDSPHNRRLPPSSVHRPRTHNAAAQVLVARGQSVDLAEAVRPCAGPVFGGGLRWAVLRMVGRKCQSGAVFTLFGIPL